MFQANRSEVFIPCLLPLHILGPTTFSADSTQNWQIFLPVTFNMDGGYLKTNNAVKLNNSDKKAERDL